MGRNRSLSRPDPTGILVLNKPYGVSSRDVLDDLEKRLKWRSLGHAGTLDPLATGILVALSGAARRLQDHFMGGLKEYVATVCFGTLSETFDGEGPLQKSPIPVPSSLEEEVRRHLPAFLGTVLQRPPVYSAVHIDGKRAHRRARAGERPEMAPRPVLIQEFELLRVEASSAVLRVLCGPGTYIRSLARDLGEAVGCGAYLQDLVRTRASGFSLDDAIEADAVTQESLVSLGRILAPFPRIAVTRSEAVALANGGTLAREIPGESGVVFGWEGDTPLCRLRPVEAGVRCDLLLVPRNWDGGPF